METKHTPGPWMFDATLKGDGSFGGSYIVSNNAKRTWPLAEVYREDNARLIAAAPELLDALKDARNAYQQMFDVMPVAWQTIDNIICDAISKATGE